MKPAAGIIGGLVVGTALGFGIANLYSNRGAQKSGPTAPETSPKSTSGADNGSASTSADIFELDGKMYSEKDLPPEIQSQLYDIKFESYEKLSGVFSQFALQKALAKEKGKDTQLPLPPLDELVDLPAPSDEEVKSLFEANKARFPEGTTFEQLRGDITRYLKSQKLSEQLRAKGDSLKQSNRFKMLTNVPVAPKVTIDIAPYVAKGPASAAHTLVEVADYLCPHCQGAAAEVETIVKDLGDKVRFVPVPYSLRPEGLSGTLARASYCARQLGDDAFWKFHEAAYRIAKTKGWKMTDPDTKEPALEVAKEAQLDTSKIEGCIASPEAKAFVTTTIQSMQKIGVSGTPTFYINGQRIQTSGKSLRDAITSSMAASH